MKIITLCKQVITTIGGGILFSSLAMGASYDLFDLRQNDFIKQEQITPLEKKVDNSFFNIDLPSQLENANKKHEYLEVLSLIKKNQLEEAENKINTLIKQDPKEPELYNLQALLETFKKNKDSASKSYQYVIALDRQNLTAHLGLSRLFFGEDNLAKSKEYANKSISINDKSIFAYFLLADIAKKENKQQDIEKYLLIAQKKIQGNIKQEIVVATNLDKLYAMQKQQEKTLSLAQDIINRYPGNSSALSFLAAAQVLNNQKQASIQTLEKLIIQEKNDIRNRLLLVKLLVNQPEKEKQVLKLLDEISSIAPNNLRVLIEKTVYLRKLKYFPEALNLARKIKQLTPTTGLGETLEGDIFLAEKRHGQALTAFKKSYEVKPNTKSLNIIANIMVSQGKQSDAIDFLNRELEKSAKNLFAHFKLASIYKKQKNVSETEKHYLAILAEQPDNALVLNNLAWLYYQQDNPKALSYGEKAYRKAPKSAVFADTYGTILVKQGELARGVKILEKASKQAPTAYDIQYHLANAYMLSGENKKAIEILNTIVKLERNFAEKNEAISLLKKLDKNSK